MQTLSSRWGPKPVVLGLAVLLWVGAVAFGMKSVLDYQVRAGRPAVAPAIWPAASTVPRPFEQPTLLIFAHPRCPCTRATLTELSRLMTRAQGRLVARMVLVIPPGRSREWARAGLWRSACEIPGLDVRFDPNGVEARRFGVSTSGQALLYDASGHLEFAGGITPGRGHEGDNAGLTTLERYTESGTVNDAATPVFGCELSAPAPDSGKGEIPCSK